MLIDNIISLTYGTLQSEPSVRDCYEIVFQSADVKRGDLFVVRDVNNIDEALFNGAYALLYDMNVTVCDDEIAWIKVDNINAAVSKILRHQLLEHSIPIISCEHVCLDIAQSVSADDRLIILKDTSLDAIYKGIAKISENSVLLINKKLETTGIFPTCKSHNDSQSSDFRVIESSLFQSSFIYHERFYDQLRISEFLLPYLQVALTFFQNYNLNYNLSKAAAIPHFEPLFVSKTLKIKEYGSTEQVIILENNTALFQQAVTFLKSRASWSRIAVFLPDSTNIIKYDAVDYIYFSSSDELMQLLKPLAFNFALVHHDNTLKTHFNEENHLRQLIFAL